MTQTALTTAETADAFEGLALGRTLHQLEKALGIKAESLLRLIRADEASNIAFKEARELSAYVLEDEMTEKLLSNYAEPANAVKNNALKMLVDHIHWVAERRNAAVYSGKAPINVSVPIQITTSLDLGQQKSLEGVYELRSDLIEEVSAQDLLSSGPPVPPPERESTPFSRLLDMASPGSAPETLNTEAAAPLDEPNTGPSEAEWHHILGEIESRQAAAELGSEESPIPRPPSRKVRRPDKKGQRKVHRKAPRARS